MPTDPAFLVQQAVWVGEHALPLFFVTLALLLAAICACWLVLRRYTMPHGQSTNSSPHAMGLRIAGGVAIILAGATVFAELAGQLAAGGVLGWADQALTNTLRTSVPRPALYVFAAFTHLGDTATLTVLCIGIALVLVARRRYWLSLAWVVTLAGNGVLNPTLKQIFGRARPVEPYNMVLVPGYSFPSGHSSGSVVAYGMLAYVALQFLPTRWHLPALVAAATLAFTISASRVFLRVHFASDVIAGLASGAAWLALCITSIELLRWWHQRTA